MHSGVNTRRTALKTVVTITCCTLMGSGIANAATRREVDQITDVSATAATDMFRFEPDLVRVSPGEEVAFLNSQGAHTVHSVPELWPEGVEPVGIAHKPEAVVRFDREGIYGFRCRRHGQYGMVMLVVAGNPPITEDTRAIIDSMRAKSRERAAFASLFDRYAQS